MNGIDSMANQLVTTTPEAPKMSDAKVQSILDKALKDILAQQDGMAKVSRNALEVCRKIGDAATKAKAALAHGKFGPWVDINFGPDNTNGTSFTPQWIRMCMRVHEVFVRLEGHKDRESILAQFGNDVKNFARLLAILEGGNNPLTFKPEARSAKLNTQGDAGDSDNAASAKVLQRKLDAAEKKIADLQAKLDKANATIAAQKLEIAELKAAAKEAAKGAKRKLSDVTDVEAKPARTHGADTLDQARLMLANKAKADKAKAAPAKAAAKPKKAPKAPKAAPAKAPKANVPVAEFDTSDVPADLLANAQSTMDTGMGANA